jgi:hypothetical protein
MIYELTQATSEEKTPIKQDKAKAKKVVAVTVTGAAEGGAADASAAASAAAAPPAPVALRHYELPISWNYGMIPRTFEVRFVFCLTIEVLGERKRRKKFTLSLSLSLSLSTLSLLSQQKT